MNLLDTNILLRQAVNTDPLYTIAVTAIKVLESNGETLIITPQGIYEFWATVTRPKDANGLGFTIAQATQYVIRFKHMYHFLPDQPSLFDEWEALVQQYNCHGKVSYDARHVAAMRTHGITRILTFNVGDFQRYPGITIIDPRTIAIP